MKNDNNAVLQLLVYINPKALGKDMFQKAVSIMLMGFSRPIFGDRVHLYRTRTALQKQLCLKDKNARLLPVH